MQRLIGDPSLPEGGGVRELENGILVAEEAAPVSSSVLGAGSPSAAVPAQTVWGRLKEFNTFWDSRFEDLKRETWARTTYRDFSAGLIVALTAIPMAMGFAMAMGLRPEQGIIAGALACVIGRTFGGSKYQVYGPTAAFIPVIAALIQKYGEAGGGTFAQAHGFLVLVSIVAGAILMAMGLFGLGKYARLVPNSIVVGFTAGIAITIAASNMESVLGLDSFKDLLDEDADFFGGFERTIASIFGNLNKINIWAVALGLLTFGLTKVLLRISIFIPAPALAIGASTLLAATVLSDAGVVVVRDIYGSIPNNFFVFTPPILPGMTLSVAFDIVYFAAAIVFVSGVESLLCSSMADRMANNRGTLFNPNKEFWGQGLVQVFTPMMNGFPCTGALARTATSIKAGAVTPLAGYFKGILKLALAYFIAGYLELVPMACIGGILLWVATNMINLSEIREVLRHNRFHAGLMVYTAVMVPATDFLTGVLSALVIYFVARGFLDKPYSDGKAIEAAARQPKAAAIVAAPGVFNKVAVPLSLTAEDDELLRYAAHLSRQGIIRDMCFVHVAPPPRGAKGRSKSAGALQKEMAESVGRRFDGQAHSINFACRALEGESRLDELVKFTLENEADLILLGHRKSRSGQRKLVRRLAMISQCSVWMAPEGSRSAITRILAPIDFSERSADSLAQAAAIARKNGLRELTALHAFFDASVIRYEEHDALVRGEEEAAFARLAAQIDLQGVAVKPQFIESGDAAQAILREAEAEGADLIVIGARGRSRAATILLGSVVSQVMRESSVPVLAIKHVGDRMTIKDVLSSGEFWKKAEARTN